MFEQEIKESNTKIDNIIKENCVNSNQINILQNEINETKKMLKLKMPIIYFISKMTIPTITLTMFIDLIICKILNIYILSLGPILSSLILSTIMTTCITKKTYNNKCRKILRKHPDYDLSLSKKELKGKIKNNKKEIEKLKETMYNKEVELEAIWDNVRTLYKNKTTNDTMTVDIDHRKCEENEFNIDDNYLYDVKEKPKVKIKK